MKRIFFSLLAGLASLALAGCTLSLLGTPPLLPTLITIPSPTPLIGAPTTTGPTATIANPGENLPTVTLSAPTATPGASPLPTTGSLPTPTTGGIIPGTPSGPYGVILIAPGEVLDIRTGAGAGYPKSGSFASTATNIMRTGPSAMVDGDLWVQVQNPGGGTGWVSANLLTEYLSQASFCADSRVTTLLTNLGISFKTSAGVTLAGQVSPLHGLTVYLWRNGTSHTFKPGDARWLFESTYEHNWGPAPASGLDTIGSFHEKVLPWLQEVFNANYSLTCNSLGTATQYGSHPWPVEYTNVNFYTVYKPGTPGVDTDFRYWLVGVEYVQNQPYVFALIHFAWEP